MSLAGLTYRGTSLLTGQPLPYLARSTEYLAAGERFGEAESWNLEGYLTGCDFADLEAERNGLLAGFVNCFGQLGIADRNFDSVEIKGVSFPDADMYGVLPYSISFTNHIFSGFSGVLNPSDTVSFTEEPNMIVSMTRNISAKGIRSMTGMDQDDSEAAINNALNFVNGRTGFFPPAFISGSSVLKSGSFFLVSSEENINRLSATVSLNQTFRADLTGDINNRPVINRFTSQVDQDDIDSTVSVDIKGEINAGRYYEEGTGGLFTTYTEFKQRYPTGVFTNENVSLDQYVNKLTYSFSFPSGTGEDWEKNVPPITDDFTLTFSENSSSSLVDVGIQGNITVPFGCIETRREKIEEVLNSGYHFDLATLLYEDFYSHGPSGQPAFVVLNPYPLSRDLTTDQTNAKASYSVRMNDRFVPDNVADIGSGQFNSAFSVELPVEIGFVRENFSGGLFILQTSNTISRESIGVNCTLQGESGTLSGYGSSAINIFKEGTDENWSENSAENTNPLKLSFSYTEKRSYDNSDNPFTLP